MTGSYPTLPVGFTSAGEGVEEDRRGGTTAIREVGAVTLQRLRAAYQLAWSLFIFSQLLRLPWSGWAACQLYLSDREYQCMETRSPVKWIPSVSGRQKKKKDQRSLIQITQNMLILTFFFSAHDQNKTAKF